MINLEKESRSYIKERQRLVLVKCNVQATQHGQRLVKGDDSISIAIRLLKLLQEKAENKD